MIAYKTDIAAASVGLNVPVYIPPIIKAGNPNANNERLVHISRSFQEARSLNGTPVLLE